MGVKQVVDPEAQSRTLPEARIVRAGQPLLLFEVGEQAQVDRREVAVVLGDLVPEHEVIAELGRHEIGQQAVILMGVVSARSEDQVVRLSLRQAVSGATISIDGQWDLPMAVGEMVEVRALPEPLRMVELSGSTPFYDLLRTKASLLPY